MADHDPTRAQPTPPRGIPPRCAALVDVRHQPPPPDAPRSQSERFLRDLHVRVLVVLVPAWLGVVVLGAPRLSIVLSGVTILLSVLNLARLTLHIGRQASRSD